MLGVGRVNAFNAVNDQGNQPPTAVAEASPTSGTAPLTVNFTGSNSSDSDGTITTYSWDFGDGNTSTQPDPTHTYQNPGTYTAVLTVRDDDDATDTDQVTITVTEAPNQPPTAIITQPADGDIFTIGETINYAGDGTDSEDGILPSSAFTWTAVRVADGASFLIATGVKSGTVTIPPNTQPGDYMIILQVEDSQGSTGTDQVTVTVTQ